MIVAKERKSSKKKFDASVEVRSIARERVGAVKPSREIVPKSDRKPKHKAHLLAEAQS